MILENPIFSNTLPPITQARDSATIEGVKLAVPTGQNTVFAPDSRQGTRLVDDVNFDHYANLPAGSDNLPPDK